MKKILLIVTTILLIVNGVLAQVPNMFNYQAVLRDASGNIIVGEVTEVDVTILAGSTNTSIFNETHTITTTTNGLVNLRIGSQEDISNIDWGADTYYIRVSVNGAIMGTSQVLSIPYAMYAKNVENIDALLLSGGTMSGEIEMGGTNKITNLAEPTNAQDAATKAYVDALEITIMALEERIEALETSLQPATIKGNTNVSKNATNEIYSIEAVTGADSYTWTVPSDALITENNGTSIIVTFGTKNGNISVTTNSAGTTSTTNIKKIIIYNH